MADRSEMARNAIESDFQIKIPYWSKMARNAIESEFQTSKMADGSHFVKKIKKKKSCVSIWNGQKCDRKWISYIQNGRRRPFCKKKFPQKIKFSIDLKWPEMRSKMFFRDPKWPTAAILSKFSKKFKVAYWSKMARNAIESEFRTSKMADGSHFVKNFKLRIDLKWPEMRSKVNFGHPKWAPAAVLWKKWQTKLHSVLI